MKLLGVTMLIASLASFGAEGPPKTGDSGTAPFVSGSSSNRDRALVIKDEVILFRANQKIVIPLKSVTGVSYSALTMLSMTVSPSTTEIPEAPAFVKTNDHLVGVVWTEQSETAGAVLKMGIGEFWPFMNALQAAGIKAVNVDVASKK